MFSAYMQTVNECMELMVNENTAKKEGITEKIKEKKVFPWRKRIQMKRKYKKVIPIGKNLIIRLFQLHCNMKIYLLQLEL
jgi:hypothetical protein